ncbi:MAG: hypothetical protein VX519_12550 [Myxococcota bacterium]|nr:hypothetical protein [Myxococcota bacterium]
MTSADQRTPWQALLSTLLLLSGFGIACLPLRAPDASVDSGGDTQSGGDSQNVWDDTGCDEPEGDAGQSYEAVAPSVTLFAGALEFLAVDGMYFDIDCATSISATQPMGGGAERALYLTLEGSLDYAGSYNVLALSLVEMDAASGNSFEFVAGDTSGVSLNVSGFGPYGAVHGRLSDSLWITDAALGDLEITTLNLQGWPKF